MIPKTLAMLAASGFLILSAVGAPFLSHPENTAHPATGVGSCTIKGWNPDTDPEDATDLPEGQRPQTYGRDQYDCTGATFHTEAQDFSTFPQPRNFAIHNENAVRSTPSCDPQGACHVEEKVYLQAGPPANPLAPYFPPFTHFVILYRENHVFDDYLGDCATTVQAGCNGVVQGTNHISSVPNLHTLAKTYTLFDAYSTGTQPPSGPNHWWLFSGQSASSSQQQAWPAGGTIFDRFLGSGVSSPSQGTDPCSTSHPAATGTPPVTFVMQGDFYWMLSTGSGEWKNPATGQAEVLPANRPGTSIPEQQDYNNYTCSALNDDDQVMADHYLNFVAANGLPTFSYVELFNDHPGTYQDIPKNDAQSKRIVDSIMGNAAYKDNTVIIVTEDDTQNGNNGPDHVSNTYRVPLVVVASPTYMKQAYLSHVAYNTNNVIAVMERTMENVHPGLIDPNNNIGLRTFPMTTADQAALGDPLEDVWVQGTTPLSAATTAAPNSGNTPLAVSFTGSATGGVAPYSYSWSFGDGATSTAQNPSHTYTTACTCTATLTVTDSKTPTPNTATSSQTITAAAPGSPLSATASANPTSGQITLNVQFTGSAAGGTTPYSYSWNFGDGSSVSTAQNPTHSYSTVGTYTATLTVTDASTPTAQTATSTVTITASPIAGTPPGAPTGLAVGAGNAQLTLNWVAPTDTGGVAISSYKVYRGTTSGGETPLTSGGCSGLGVVLSCTDSGLTNGQAYFYKVSAVNAIGEGAQSTEASGTPIAAPLAQSFDASTAIPAGWTATGLWRVGGDCQGADSAPNSLQFNNPSQACTYNPLRSSGFATSPSFDISAASAPVLTFNTKYQVESYSGHTDQMKVQAKTATGAWTDLWTKDSTNPAQTTWTQVSLSLASYKSTGTQIRFSFDSMDTFARSYPGWAVDDVLVDPGTVTAPSAPTGLTATGTYNQVNLAWTAPASNGGAAITSYKVYRSTTSGGETLLTAGGCSGLGNVLACTDASGTNGQVYYYKVAATNSAGTGAQSNEASATPLAPTPPGAPTGLAAAAGNAQVSLSWAAPSSDGGSAITSYKVYRSTTSGGETLLAGGGCSGLGAVLSCTDTGLTNGQAYYYKVAATNAIGTGAQSGEASATPSAAPPQIWVNEMESNPPGTDNGFEYAELYNPGASAVDVTGWTITANGGAPVTLTLSGTIAAHGYKVVTSATQWLDNTGESLTLKTGSGTVVDATPVHDDTSNDSRSWQRVPDGSSNWVFRTSTQGATNGT